MVPSNAHVGWGCTKVPKLSGFYETLFFVHSEGNRRPGISVVTPAGWVCPFRRDKAKLSIRRIAGADEMTLIFLQFLVILPEFPHISTNIGDIYIYTSGVCRKIERSM
jgi:hypothetical protein